MITLLGIIAVTVIAVTVGIFLGSRGNDEPLTSEEVKPTDDCASSCTQWQERKSQLCEAERSERDAKDRLEVINDLLKAVGAGTVSAVVGLLGSAGLVALLGGLGVPAAIAIALLVGGILLAASAAAVIIALTAASITAWAIWTSKQAQTNSLQRLEGEARNALYQQCSQEDIAACLANSPC